MPRHIKHTAITACLFAFLTACGGGGSSVIPMIESPLDQPFQMPASGTATYIGEATGAYTTRYGTDFSNYPVGSIGVGEYLGQLRLTADFDNRIISGDIHDIDLINISVTYPETAITRDIEDIPDSGYEILLGNADINEAGHFIGNDIELTHPDIDTGTTTGSWSGIFSGNHAVGGSHSGHTMFPGGSQSSWIGTHHGTSNP